MTHETRRAWGPFRQVFVLCRAYVCGSGLKGRFPVAQGAALGQGHPQKIVLRPEGPISRRVWFSRSCTGFPGADAPGSAEIGPSGLGGAIVAFVWFVPCVCLRFRPETPISRSPGRSHCHARFCRGHGSKECAAQSTPNGPTAIHNLAVGNARGTGIRAPEAVPEFTANAFADHNWRIRLATFCQPKTMNSLRCSGGTPSPTPHIMGNDKG